MFDTRISRKAFFKHCFSGLLALACGNALLKPVFAATQGRGFNGRPKRPVSTDYDLVSVNGEDPYAITVKAVKALGGMEKFVARNGVVVIKPNIGWDRTPQQAGNTNPQVVAALIDLSFGAGAKKVKIFDITCNDPRRCYANSGIEETARGKKADIYFPDDWDVIKARFDFDSPMEGWPVLNDAIECDTFINVPVLKHHGLTNLTISMKNLMGVCAGRRGLIHQDIGRKLVDLTMFINPDLNVIDAFRVLVRNGPTGGDLNDVSDTRTVLASTDATLADIYAARLMGVDPASVPNILNAIERGIGNSDVDAARIAELKV